MEQTINNRISTSTNSNNINFKCDHKAETEKRQLEDKRRADEQSKNWDEIYQKMMHWGPERFNSKMETGHEYSLFTICRYFREEELNGNTCWSITSEEATLLITDLEYALFKLSHLYLQEDKRMKQLNATNFKTFSILEKCKTEMETRMPTICQIETISSQLFTLTSSIFFDVKSLQNLVVEFEQTLESNESKDDQNVQDSLQKLSMEHFTAAQLADHQCNEALKILANCETMITREIMGLRTTERSAKEGKPIWQSYDREVKIFDIVNRLVFVNTGAIPKALQSSRKVKQKKRKKKSKPFVDRPPGPIELEFGFADELVDLDEWRRNKISENLILDDDDSF